MYEVIFAQADGQVDLFDAIVEIRTGKDIYNMETIDKNEVLNYAFNTKNVYQLIGKNKNIIYYCHNVNYVSVNKTSD